MITRLYTLETFTNASNNLNDVLLHSIGTHKDCTPSKAKRDHLRKKRKNKRK